MLAVLDTPGDPITAPTIHSGSATTADPGAGMTVAMAIGKIAGITAGGNTVATAATGTGSTIMAAKMVRNTSGIMAETMPVASGMATAAETARIMPPVAIT